MTMGRCSIYLVSVMQLISSFGLMMIYFIVFGDTFASISRQLITSKDNFWTSRVCYVMFLGALLTPLIVQKKLAELKIISYTLFVAIGLFVIIFFI